MFCEADFGKDVSDFGLDVVDSEPEVVVFWVVFVMLILERIVKPFDRILLISNWILVSLSVFFCDVDFWNGFT